MCCIRNSYEVLLLFRMNNKYERSSLHQPIQRRFRDRGRGPQRPKRGTEWFEFHYLSDIWPSPHHRDSFTRECERPSPKQTLFITRHRQLADLCAFLSHYLEEFMFSYIQFMTRPKWYAHRLRLRVLCFTERSDRYEFARIWLSARMGYRNIIDSQDQHIL